MKKFISGIVVGAMIFTGISVSAAEIKSKLIGKKVQATMIVTIDGKLVDKDAIVINGASYLPVRAITDAIEGKIISVKDGKIELVTNDLAKIDENARKGAEEAEQLQAEANKVANEANKKEEEKIKNDSKINRINTLIESIKNNKSYLKAVKEELASIEKKIEMLDIVEIVNEKPIYYKDTDMYKNDLQTIIEYKETIKSLELKIAEMEQELKELQMKK
ncbi:hypothetical protein EBB07_06015 [Paenibacillaceae bacterium]|nr:hypothetical protein EBB07_06015 [Paenibacillaceae bacterium]